MAEYQPKRKLDVKNPGTRAGRAGNKRGQSFTYEDMKSDIDSRVADMRRSWAAKWEAEAKKLKGDSNS